MSKRHQRNAYVYHMFCKKEEHLLNKVQKVKDEDSIRRGSRIKGGVRVNNNVIRCAA